VGPGGVEPPSNRL